MPPEHNDPPFELPEAVELRRDVVYRQTVEQDLQLDLFLPADAPGLRPAVVYIHGGGWRNGTRTHFWRQAAHMAQRGFVGATIAYRLSGVARYPAAVDDCEAAVRWLQERADEYQVDPARVGSAGGSAGGHLAALLGADAVVGAVAAFNPVIDMTALDPVEMASEIATEFLGGSYDEEPDRWREASPVHRASDRSAPMLLLHGTADTLVPYEQTTAMHEKLTGLGVRAELYTAAGVGHGFFNRPPWFAPTLARMAQFFEEELR